MKENSFHEEVIIAGFGGQGIMLAGKLLGHTAMVAGKEVTYMPSYGAEVRMVILDDEPIASPIVSNPTSLIVMNKASLSKFAPRLKSGGLLIVNSSLIEKNSLKNISPDIEISAVPANEIAVKLGNIKAANMVALGTFLQKRKLFGPEAAAKSLPKVLAKRHHKTLPVNSKALNKGAEFAKEQ